jgi:hypothetical protein
LEGRLEIDFGGQDQDVGKELMGGDDPIHDPLDACAKKAGEELFCLDAAVDRSARQSLEALVVGLAVQGKDFAKFIDGVLLLYIHWSDEDAWNLQKLRWMARQGKGCNGNDERPSQNGLAGLLEALSALSVNQRKRDGAGRANPERFPPQFHPCCCLHITKDL